MKKLLLFFFVLSTFLNANEEVRKLAAKMIMIGFDGYKPPAFLKKYNIAGVILFSKNIKNPIQLKNLTTNLKKIQKDILIAVDQEGGKVQRLSKKNGFVDFKSAYKVKDPKKTYKKMAQLLKKYNINLNLAPVVDLRINPNNPVIAKLNRSFSKDPDIVIKKASIFVKAMKEQKILTALKHFPGHGSSQKDSHKGFVDVSSTWQEKELLPFLKIDSPLIMSAHIFNSRLDPKYPATLSYKTNTILLRQKLNYKGVLISDDLQMGAISKNYSFKKALELAINSGVDILLIGNYLKKPVKLEKIINTIDELVKEKKVSIKRLKEANKRIEKLLTYL